MCSLTKKKINEAATYKQACTLVILIITHICFAFFDIEIMTFFRQNIRHPGYFLIAVTFFLCSISERAPLVCSARFVSVIV